MADNSDNPDSIASDASDANEHTDQLAAENEIRERLDGKPVDFASLDAVSNIYRAATAVRRRAEQDVLAANGLSFGGFTILWVLWMWGEMETARLADECGLAKGTLTGMLMTLEKQDLVQRTRSAVDRRRVLVDLTGAGTALISRVFPTFNRFEADITSALSADDKRELARLLRLVIRSCTTE